MDKIAFEYMPNPAHVVFAVCAALGAGCGADTKPESLDKTEQSAQAPAPVAAAGPLLNTFDARCLQIDQLAAPAIPPADANLFVGNDPADGTASRDFPVCSSGPYIDWQTLSTDLANHRLLDCPGDPAQCASGKDPTSFPRSNECVGTSSVLSKMDLTYVAASSNSQFAYFAVRPSAAPTKTWNPRSSPRSSVRSGSMKTSSVISPSASKSWRKVPPR